MRFFFVNYFFVSLRNIFGKRSDLPFSRKSDRKKEKSVVSFTHEQNSICSQKQLNDIAHEHTIICRQLFAGHVVGSRPMKRKKLLHRMIIKSVSVLSILIYKHNNAWKVAMVCCTVFTHELWKKRYLPHSLRIFVQFQDDNNSSVLKIYAH